jgi:hypothetical protein
MEGKMRHRVFIVAGSLAAGSLTLWLSGVVVAGQAPSQAAAFKVPAATYTPPKTPWGDPDLQGVWDNHTTVPMQRPANLKGKRIFTDEELAARARARGDNEPLCNQRDERCAKATVAELDRLRAYNSFWTPQAYVYDNRTALIEDPEDGRIPPMTPEAIARQKEHLRRHPPTDASAAVIEIRHWEDYDLAERCIAAQVPTTTMGYNSAQYLMQSPGWVMLAHERLNTRVIPLDGRPHLGGTMGGWMGDSRGRWEGNTLVVETRSFTNKQSGGSVGAVADPGIPFGNFHVTEYFVPVGPNRLQYYVTINDPRTWTRPWTFMQPWEKDRVLSYSDNLGAVETEPYQIYEYACHEGNNTLGNSMRGTLQARQRAASLPPDAELTKSLIGKGEAEIRALFGAPDEIAGPRWQYSTSNGILLFWAFFEGGKVVRVRPDDIRLTEVVPNK